MIVNTSDINPALKSLFEHPEQTLFLDANIFIPPDRTNLGAKNHIPFSLYKDEFLIPIFECFTGLAIHESVYNELVSDDIKNFAISKTKDNPISLKIYKDDMLDSTEKQVYESYVTRMSKYSQYDPSIGIYKDRGEVLSLSYMVAKSFLYFAANDNLPINIVNNIGEFKAELEEFHILQSYEIIYYLQKTGKYSSKSLKALYKYMYRLTNKEQSQNPEWGMFISNMDQLYGK